MRAVWAFGVASAALLAAGAAQAREPSVEIKDAVARVTVIPEDRTDIKVVVLKTHPSLPLVVRVQGDKTIVDGDLDKGVGRDRIRNCTTIGDRTSVKVEGVGKVDYEDMPEVVIRVPNNAKVGAGGAVWGSVGRSNALEFSSAGCGDWTLANVNTTLKVNLAGSGDVRAGTSASAKVNVAGSGDAALAAVGGELSINIAGSGDVSAGAVSGPLSANIVGSGDVKVASVVGSISANLAGSGDVQVRGGRADSVSAKIAGSGDVRFGGEAGSVDARVAGSGDVRVGKVTGSVNKSIMGSGDVVIGEVAFKD